MRLFLVANDRVALLAQPDVWHEAEGRHVQYGAAGAAQVLADEVLPKFRYPDLDLSELKCRQGFSGIRRKN